MSAARSDPLAARLLRCEVRRGAEHGARLGVTRRLERACNPEVRELHLPVARAENVLRLDVAVHEVRRVRGLERSADLDADRDDLGGRQPATPRELVGERLAVDVLHDDVRPAFVLADVVDLHDVRVDELRREAAPRAGSGRGTSDRSRGALQAP